MKKTFWLTLGMAVSIPVFADGGSALTNETPSAATPAAAATKPAASASTPGMAEPAVNLSPGKATVTGDNVNVRGQATINSEVVARLNTGDSVTVIEQINLDSFKPNEPRQWAKIMYPEGENVWVHSSFIDKATMTVDANRLNLRTGPGENYSIAGVIERGTPVKEVSAQGDWLRITPPDSAYAFMAAMYLHQDAPQITAVPPTETTPPPTEPKPADAMPPTTVLTPAEPVVAPPVEHDTTAGNLIAMPTPDSTVEPEPPAEPPPPRVVSHEGVVRRTLSIQAPTPYALVNPATGKTVNYLYSPTTNLDLSLYRGLRIVVTGEESLDTRWSTPVVNIRRIHVLE